MYRFFATGVLLLWVSAMAALLARDVWPAWTAQDPPPITAERLANLDRGQQQFSIAGADGKRMGTAWSELSRTGPETTIRGTILLDALPHIPVIVIRTSTVFEAEGKLDSFKLHVYGVPMTKISVRGERRGIYFPCELHLGPIHRQVNLDLAASRLIGESLRPFSYLPALHVGQSWRMQLLDPLSAAMGSQADFTSIVARVTGTETIEYPQASGQWIECFVVQTSPRRSKAWVDRNGHVLIQEVQTPGLGRITVREEPFDEAERRRVESRLGSGARRGAPTSTDSADEVME